MNPDIPTPAGSLSAEYRWPRYKPLFSGLACVMSLIVAAGVFAWQYKRQWTPLERYYLPAFIRTAHFTVSHNPYLRPARTWEILVIQFTITVSLRLTGTCGTCQLHRVRPTTPSRSPSPRPSLNAARQGWHGLPSGLMTRRSTRGLATGFSVAGRSGKCSERPGTQVFSRLASCFRWPLAGTAAKLRSAVNLSAFAEQI